MLLERDFPPDLRVENEAMALVEAGHKICIACYSRSGKASVDDWNGIRVIKKPISGFIYKSSVGCLKFPFYFHFWRNFVSEIVGQENIEAIHVHDLPLALIGFECKQLNSTLFILDLHENWPAYLAVSQHIKGIFGRMLSSIRQWKAYEMRMIHAADTLIVVVDEARNRLINLGIEPEKIKVVSNYINYSGLDKIRPRPKKKKPFTMLYAGGINRHRGLQYIVQAIPSIVKTHPHVTLEIAGTGNYLNHLKQLARSLGVADQINFCGQVAYHKVLEMIAEANVTLIPHIKSEHTDTTLPHKLFQYLYFEKPVITSDCAPIERIVRGNGVGCVYHYNNTEEFASTICKLISGEITITYKREPIIKKYNWEDEKAKLLLIYQ